MNEENPTMECEVCGGLDFHKEAGHFYCNECQTQSQHVQEHVFDQGDEFVNKKATRKIQKTRPDKSEEMLTSWECYNYILKGLTQELVDLGAKPELTVVVRCLWMKYLHKCEVFDVNSDRPPKLSILGSKKDVKILYNVKKRKRRRSRTSSTSTTMSVQRQRSTKKRALVKSQYEELSQSQNNSQDTSMLTDTLSNVKSSSEASEGSQKIKYNRYSNKELKRLMSKKHRKQHIEDLDGELTCHKFRARSFTKSFFNGPTNLTTFTLYAILYLALLLIEDDIQLGDMLRYIREGHLSFGCFKHFFDENISDKALNLPQRMEKLFSHGIFRKRCFKMAEFLDLFSYIEPPDIAKLCSRYCAELNLPQSILECAEKLIAKTRPKMELNKHSKMIPNYEARAMTFIVFSLKLLFGLDGVTEYKFSEYAKILNSFKLNKMFNFSNWLRFMRYRHAVIKCHHLPTSLCDNIDSDMYLGYLKKQDIKFKGSSRHIHSEVKDYLQVLEKILEDVDESVQEDLVFRPSLTPFFDYTRLILRSKHVPGKEVLKESFSADSLDFLLQPNEYLKLLRNTKIKNGGANDNIIMEDLMYLYKATVFEPKRSKKLVTIKVESDLEDDKYVDEFLDLQGKQSLATSNVEVLLSNWQQGNKKEFQINKDLLQAADKGGEVNLDNKADLYKQHYQPFERYWLNIPTNPIAHYFAKQDMDKIMAKFPHSFRMILEEASRIVEQDACDFYSEYLMSELYLVYLTDFGCKSKKGKRKGMLEIRKMLEACDSHW